MITYPLFPVLGGAPRITGAIVALASDDTLITGPEFPSDMWTDGVGWDPDFWEASWIQARGDLQSLFEEPWGDLRDKLYWFITAPLDPEAAGHADYVSPANFFKDQLIGYLNPE